MSGRVVKSFDREKGLPFWWVEFDGDTFGPFSTREEAWAYIDGESTDEEDDRLRQPRRSTADER